MNKKGQSLTIFIIILPVIFNSLAFTFDYATIINEQMKYESVTKTILKSTQDEEEIKTLYQKNGYSTNNFNYKLDEDKIYIQNNYKFKSTFGKIINIKNYNIKINYIVINTNNGIIIEENKGGS